MSDTITMKVLADTSRAQQDLDSLNKAVGKIAGTTDKVASGFAVLAAGIAAAFLAVGTSNGLLKAADEAQMLENRLKLVTKSVKELTQVQVQLLNVSQRSLSTFSSANSIYFTFAKSLDRAKASTEDLLAVTESTQKAVALSGGSAESANAAITQLGQAMASGTLRGEELNSVMEQTPRLAQAIADGLGVTIGSLRKLAEAGELTSDVVFKSLLSQTETLGKEFKTMTITATQGFSLLSSAISAVTGSAAVASGIFANIGAGLAGLATKVLEYKLLMDATAAVLNMRLARAAYNVKAIFEGLSEIMGALGARFKLMIPIIHLMQRDLSTLTSLAFVSELFRAESALGRIGLSIRKLNPLIRQMTSYSFVNITDAGTVGYAIRDLFAVDSIVQFKMEVNNVIAAINDWSSRDWKSNLRDILFNRESAEFVMNLKDMGVMFGVLESRLIRIENVRFDMFIGGLRDIAEFMAEFMHYDIYVPLRRVFRQFQLFLYDVALLFLQYGRSMGSPFGDMFIGIGTQLTKLAGISTAIESITSAAFETIRIVITNGILSVMLSARIILFAAGSRLATVLGTAMNSSFATMLGKLGGGAEKIMSKLFVSFDEAIVPLSARLGISAGNGLKNALISIADGVWEHLIMPFNPAHIFKKLFSLDLSQMLSSKIFGAFSEAAYRLNHATDLFKLNVIFARMFRELTGQTTPIIDSLNDFGLSVLGVLKFPSLHEAFTFLLSGSLLDDLRLLSAKIENTFNMNPTLDAIERFATAVKDFFFDIYDAVVGHSYWPDMINGVIEWSHKLNNTGLKIVNKFKDGVISSFAKIKKGVIDLYSGMGNIIGNLFKGKSDEDNAEIAALNLMRTVKRIGNLLTNNAFGKAAVLQLAPEFVLNRMTNKQTETFGQVYDFFHNLIEKIYFEVLHLDTVSDYIYLFAKRIKAAFFDIYDAVVGHSYWPDMINGVIDWSHKLAQQALPAVTGFTTSVGLAFIAMRSTVTNSLTGLMDSINAKILNKSWSSSFEDGLKSLADSASGLYTIGDKPINFKIATTFITDGLSQIPSDTIANIARIAGVAVLAGVASVFFPAISAVIVSYMGLQAASAFIAGVSLSSRDLFGVDVFRELGEGLGDIIGAVVMRGITSLPSLIADALSFFAGFGNGLLDQFGILGTLVSGILNMFSLGNGGLLFALILGGAAGYNFLHDKITSLLEMIGMLGKADSKTGVRSASAIGELIPDSVKAKVGEGFAKLFGGLSPKYLTLAAGTAMLGFTEEVNAVQATLMTAPLLFTAIFGEDVAGKVAVDLAKALIVKIGTIFGILSKQAAGSSIIEKLLGADKADKLKAAMDKATAIVKKGYANIAAITDPERRKAYMDGQIDLRGLVSPDGLPSRGFVGRAQLPDGSFVGEAPTIKQRIAKNVGNFGGVNIEGPAYAAGVASAKVIDGAKSKLETFKSFASKIGEAFSGMASKVGSVFRDVKNGADVAAATMSANARQAMNDANVHAENMNNGNGIFSRAMMGKYTKWAAIAGAIAALTLFSTSAKAATNSAGDNVETLGDRIISRFKEMGVAILEIGAPIAAFLLMIHSMGGGFILFGILKGLIAIGGAIVSAVGGMVLAIVGTIIGVGLLGLAIFGEGDSFTDRLVNAKNGMLSFFGVMDKEINSKQAKLNELFVGSKDTEAGMKINTMLNDVNFSELTAPNERALTKLVTHTNEILERNAEILALGNELDATNIAEQTKALAAIQKVVDSIVIKEKGRGYENFNNSFVAPSENFWDAPLMSIIRSLGESFDIFGEALINIVGGLGSSVAKIYNSISGAMSNEWALFKNDLKKIKDFFTPKSTKVDPYAGVKEKMADSSDRFDSFKAGLTASEIKAMQAKVTELANAYKVLTTAEKEAWTNKGGKVAINNARAAVEGLTIGHDNLLKSMEKVGKARMANTKFNADMQTLSLGLDVLGLKFDKTEFVFNEPDTAMIMAAMDDANRAVAAFTLEADVDVKVNLKQVSEAKKLIVKELIESKVAANAGPASMFEDLIKRSGSALKLEDLKLLDTSKLEAIKLHLTNAATAANDIMIAFKSGNPLANAATTAEQMRISLEQAAKIARPKVDTAKAISATAAEGGLTLDETAVGRLSPLKKIEYERYAYEAKDAKAKIDSGLMSLNQASPTEKDNIARLDQFIRENKLFIAKTERKFARESDTTVFRDSLEDLAFKVTKSGLSITPDQILGLSPNFQKEGLDLITRASEIKDKIFNTDPSVDGLSAVAAFTEELRDLETRGKLLALNALQPIEDVFTTLFSKIGDNFDLGKFFALPDKASTELAFINKELKRIAIIQASITSKGGVMNAKDKAHYIQLNNLKQQFESKAKFIKSRESDTDGERLKKLGSATGVSLSDLEFSKLGDSQKAAIRKAMSVQDGLDFARDNPKSNSKEDRQAAEDAYTKGTDINAKNATRAAQGELAYLLKRNFINFELNTELLGSTKAYKDIQELLKGINYEEEDRLLLKVQAGNATDAELTSLRAIWTERKRVQGLITLAEKTNPIGNTMRELEEKMARLGNAVDSTVIARMSATSAAAMQQLGIDYNDKQLKFKGMKVGSTEAATTAVELEDMKKRLNSVNDKVQQTNSMAGSFRSAGTEFVKGVLTNTEGAWSTLLTSVGGTIFESVTAKISDTLFGSLADTLAGALIGVGPDGSTKDKSLWVRLYDALIPTGDNITNTGSEVPRLFSGLQDTMDQLMNGLGKGFNGFLGAFGKMIMGQAASMDSGKFNWLGAAVQAVGAISGAMSTASMYSLGTGVNATSGISAAAGGTNNLNLTGSLASTSGFNIDKLGNSGFKLKLAGGGPVFGPGTGTSDSIMAMLSNGEYVINANATSKYGKLLAAINSDSLPKFATGGLVGGAGLSPYDSMMSGQNAMSNVTSNNTKNVKTEQVFNINVTGNISQQTRKEIQMMIPQIATGVNTHNYETGNRRR